MDSVRLRARPRSPAGYVEGPQVIPRLPMGNQPRELHYLETDGSTRPGERHRSGTRLAMGGAGVVLWAPDLSVQATSSLCLGPVSCGQEVELRAVIAGLQLARERGVTHVRLRSDFLEVVRYPAGERALEGAWAEPLRPVLDELVREFEHLEARWTRSSHARDRREGVPTADWLARQALGLAPRSAHRR
jgi:ribonuclease HI